MLAALLDSKFRNNKRVSPGSLGRKIRKNEPISKFTLQGNGIRCKGFSEPDAVEHGVNHKLLRDDRGLGMNKLLDYIRILKLDQSLSFLVSQLQELRKNRNDAIHAGLLVRKGRELTEADLNAFNKVIRYFGR